MLLDNLHASLKYVVGYEFNVVESTIFKVSLNKYKKEVKCDPEAHRSLTVSPGVMSVFAHLVLGWDIWNVTSTNIESNYVYMSGVYLSMPSAVPHCWLFADLPSYPF